MTNAKASGNNVLVTLSNEVDTSVVKREPEGFDETEKVKRNLEVTETNSDLRQVRVKVEQDETILAQSEDQNTDDVRDSETESEDETKNPLFQSDVSSNIPPTVPECTITSDTEADAKIRKLKEMLRIQREKVDKLRREKLKIDPQIDKSDSD